MLDFQFYNKPASMYLQSVTPKQILHRINFSFTSPHHSQLMCIVSNKYTHRLLGSSASTMRSSIAPASRRNGSKTSVSKFIKWREWGDRGLWVWWQECQGGGHCRENLDFNCAKSASKIGKAWCSCSSSCSLLRLTMGISSLHQKKTSK